MTGSLRQTDVWVRTVCYDPPRGNTTSLQKPAGPARQACPLAATAGAQTGLPGRENGLNRVGPQETALGAEVWLLLT